MAEVISYSIFIILFLTIVVIIVFKIVNITVKKEEDSAKDSINKIFDEAEKKMNFRKVGIIATVIGFITSIFTGHDSNENNV